MFMEVTERESWLLNFYRNSELHGALLMGKLARNFHDAQLLVNLTKHCATEARHAALLTETIVAVGVPLDPHTETIQNHYASEGGLPKELVDLLVLSETLEKRVLTSYHAHLAGPDVHPQVRRTLNRIVREMEEEEDGEHAGWIEQALQRQPRERVDAAEAKWRAVDERVAAALEGLVAEKFQRKPFANEIH
jgi:hypothetical protein